MTSPILTEAFLQTDLLSQKLNGRSIFVTIQCSAHYMAVSPVNVILTVNLLKVNRKYSLILTQQEDKAVLTCLITVFSKVVFTR